MQMSVDQQTSGMKSHALRQCRRYQRRMSRKRESKCNRFGLVEQTDKQKKQTRSDPTPRLLHEVPKRVKSIFKRREKKEPKRLLAFQVTKDVVRIETERRSDRDRGSTTSTLSHSSPPPPSNRSISHTCHVSHTSGTRNPSRRAKRASATQRGGVND